MDKTEFIKNIIFCLYKDEPYNDTKCLKCNFKKLLNCDYHDENVGDCFIKITNYQIKKYGTSLYVNNKTNRR